MAQLPGSMPSHSLPLDAEQAPNSFQGLHHAPGLTLSLPNSTTCDRRSAHRLPHTGSHCSQTLKACSRPKAFILLFPLPRMLFPRVSSHSHTHFLLSNVSAERFLHSAPSTGKQLGSQLSACSSLTRSDHWVSLPPILPPSPPAPPPYPHTHTPPTPPVFTLQALQAAG